VFLTIIKLIAPYLPHITEEIYQQYFRPYYARPSIHKSGFPPVNPDNTEQGIEQVMNITLEVVELVRKFKSESQIAMGTALSKLIISASSEQQKAIQLFEDDVKGITKAQAIEWKEGNLGVECVLNG
jgi:valyl-tRNA synthetase